LTVHAQQPEDTPASPARQNHCGERASSRPRRGSTHAPSINATPPQHLSTRPACSPAHAPGAGTLPPSWRAAPGKHCGCVVARPPAAPLPPHGRAPALPGTRSAPALLCAVLRAINGQRERPCPGAQPLQAARHMHTCTAECTTALVRVPSSYRHASRSACRRSESSAFVTPLVRSFLSAILTFFPTVTSRTFNAHMVTLTSRFQ
jgi:hypothetical protein